MQYSIGGRAFKEVWIKFEINRIRIQYRSNNPLETEPESNPPENPDPILNRNGIQIQLSKFQI